MESQTETHRKQKKWLRLLLFPLPLQGHVIPMLQLANLLYSKGFSITIIHTCFISSPKYPSKNPHFTFHSIPNGLSKSECSNADNLVSFISLLNANCAEPFRDCLVKLLSDVSDEPVAGLISDSTWKFTDSIAKSLQLPRFVLRTTNISSFLALAALPLLQEKGYLPKQESQEEKPVIELPPLKVKDIPVFKTQDQEGLHQTIAALVEQTKSCTGVIWNSFEELEHGSLTDFRYNFRVPIFPIGPLHKYFPVPSTSLLSQDQSAISWLNKQAPKSVIYVSFGSVASIEKSEFVEIAWGLANSEQPFLWVVRPGSVIGSEWLEPLPKGFMEEIKERGHVVKWAPQQEVLAHTAVGGFWTHSGWNSTLESFCEGVPMICHPCFGDQRVNARYVSDVWRIGVHLENKVDRFEIAKVVRKLLVEAEGHEIRDRILQFKKMADQSTQQQGSSYRSLESLVSQILSSQSQGKL
ncbi:hypothetical protein ES319_A05G366800v1 [Gossypium barbadense]|uniref:Glycosyltransferase n=2 Tax=Gossypium TaxID=3633 RepID=A0A2P5YVW3_GOSBA|nr:hypothetical protein ES319_A05G366800v1 [Gossypium barbadense]PPS19745.1 hypothetical protein GOBAR_AA00828 [Gossypium barbadense]TYH19899.1 hypothetical protein ES288_A05G388600v1 [Gossypium darwinii]